MMGDFSINLPVTTLWEKKKFLYTQINKAKSNR